MLTWVTGLNLGIACVNKCIFYYARWYVGTRAVALYRYRKREEAECRHRHDLSLEAEYEVHDIPILSSSPAHHGRAVASYLSSDLLCTALLH